MESQNNRPLRGITGYFSLLMALVYLTMGFAILLVPTLFQEIPKGHKLPFGFVLLVYGSYRGVKWLKSRTETHD